MGHFLSALREIHKHAAPSLVITEDKPSANEVVDYCVKNNIPYAKVKTFSDISVATEAFESIDLTVVASFGLILKNEYIRKNRYIVNFHPGDIPACRGRHPLPCAIKYRHEFMGITAHLIQNEKIDAGPICHKVLLPIDYTDSYKGNEKRLLSVLPMMVEKIISEFLRTDGLTAVAVKSDGNYYRPLTGEELDRIFNAKTLGDIDVG